MNSAAIESQDWIAYHALAAPEREALHDLNSGRRFSYREMDARIGRAALYLSASLGVGEGQRVAVLNHNDSDTFEIQFACRRLGAIFLPLNARLSIPELDDVCRDARPSVLLYGMEFSDAAEHLSQACAIPAMAGMNNGADSDYERGICGADGTFEPKSRKLNDTWTILYTSGTSGRPKGTLITYGMAHFNAVDATMVGALTSCSKNLVLLPMFHTGGLNVWANPVFHVGGCNVVMRAFAPGLLLKCLSDKDLGVTHTLGVPTNFLMMAQEPEFADADLSHLRCLCVGGAAAPKALLLKYFAKGVKLRAMYGMTEIGPLGLALPEEKGLQKIGSSGVPTMHTRMKICNRDGTSTSRGEVGELLIKGPSVTPGYWEKPKETAAAFDADGWFHTGDAARQDEDGYFYLVDRWKDMFISGGENVYPIEVENAIYLMDGVLETAVVGIPDEKWGEVGCAYLVPRENAKIDGAAVIEHCKRLLAGYKVPKKVRLIEELPHNATGKILKHKLPRE